MNLEDRCAVVTGASGNLGRAVLASLLQARARVVAVAGSEEGLARLQPIAATEAGRCLAVRADVTTEEGVAELADVARAFFGDAQILVNLAGGYRGGANLWETSVSDWDHMLVLNLRSVFLCCRAFLPGMLGQGYGRIVNVSSKAAFALRPGSAAYAVSKMGVATLTQALREEFKGTGVSVAAVVPSVIDSPASRAEMPKAEPAKWVPPEDLATVIVSLCTQEGGLVSGGLLPVYGGL